SSRQNCRATVAIAGSPDQSSFDGLLHPQCLSAQGYARGERIPRERLHEHPGSQMSFWTARDSIESARKKTAQE
ncbi:MAG: hypothetical protein MUQ65_11565, partial [Armatimonadetes bacterium]|nr:hypothetical protein [Armatimonadota bacterium]